MPLLDLKTDLKSLKYGQDRPDGGSSKQPYIKTDINTIDSGFNQLRLTKFDDGLIRDGVIGSTNVAITDTLRIGKFLTDAPKGPLFIVKQVGLQLSNPKLETRPIPTLNVGGFFGSLVNAGIDLLNKNSIGPTRIYNLGINTLAQIPVNHLGGHIVRHGLLPTQDPSKYYEAVVRDNAGLNNNNVNTALKDNRLLKLTNKFQLGKVPTKTSNKGAVGIINKVLSLINQATSIFGASIPSIKPTDLTIDSYLGGPGSTYGIGTTTINRTSFTADASKINFSLTQSNQFAGKTRNSNGGPTPVNYSTDVSQDKNAISNYNFPEAGSTSGVDQTTIKYYSPALKTYAELQNQIEKQNKLTQSYYDGNITGSFTSSISSKDSFVTHDSKNYRYYGDKRIASGSFGSKAIYNNTEVYSRKDADILTVIFRAINPFSDYTNTETIKERWAFSAYINGFRDSFDAIWNETNYVGRAESFYIYNKFKRSVSFNLQIPCFNKVELFKKHRALGQLASTTAGSYNNNLLGGVILQLNVGNYIVGEYAILNNINYEIPNESAWDVSSDALLAMNINASFNFNIIHKRLPQYTQSSKSNPNTGFFGYLKDPPIPNPNQNIKDADFFISSEKLKEFTKDQYGNSLR
jgi:hypothetical protein